MKICRANRFLVIVMSALLFLGCDSPEISHHPAPAVKNTTRHAKVVFLAGWNSHGPLAHEHHNGSKLLSEALQEREPGIETVVSYGDWPQDESIFEGADALVLYCDGGEKNIINQHLETFNKLVESGVGVVALHYCLEVLAHSEASKAMLSAIGGYFETHWSVNPHWRAFYDQLPNHEITQNIEPFSLKDEWYFNMRFQPGLKGVTPILSAIPPMSTVERGDGPHSGNAHVRELVNAQVPQITAWAYERPDGARGFGYTGGHSHLNWRKDDARNLVLNAIVWSTRQ